MKKIIAIISALVIAASMTACAAEKSTNETAETTAATTTTAETEAATEAETTTVSEAEATTEAAPKAEDDTVESIDDVFANRADGLWAIDLANKASQWSANVKVKASYEIGGIVSDIEIETLGDKFISKVEVVDMMSSTQIFDGTNYYMIDGVKKTYCINPNGSEGVDNYMLAVDETDSFTDAGIEEIGGTKYIYEEYDRMGEITRYYFDEFGNLAHYSVNMYGEVTYMTMTVEFADEADETVFAPPADCTEVPFIIF